MTSPGAPVFALPDRLSPKRDPALIAADEAHLALLGRTLRAAVDDLERRLTVARRRSGGSGQAAMDRDQEVHRLTSRLRTLSRHGLDLCLGRMVHDDGTTSYVGRVGLAADDGSRLLVDWRTPAAEPFFAATHGDPRGLVSRRRYRWTDGRITDYWDEVFTGLDDIGSQASAALDDQSSFVAGLGAERTARMRDVLATITADQDAVVRAGSRGVFVVDGGPGTGKTVVALHRTAYLLHADPRLGRRRGGVLVVGPHQPYLAYVSDVLPGLGEEGVRTCTLRDLVPEGARAVPEPDPAVARLKADRRMVEAIEPAVALHEEPPTTGADVETPWGDVWLSAADWAEAFAAPDPGTAHNDARDVVRDALVDRLVEKVRDDLDGDADPADVRRALAANADLRDAIGRAWPRVDATDVVGDLWTVPAYLRHCAPWLAPDEVRALRRDDPRAWTDADLPLLDAARHRLGDPGAARRRRAREARVAAERARMDDVVDHLVATDDSEMHVMSMLRASDARSVVVEAPTEDRSAGEELAGPFAHVVVDEAQELDDAQWQVLRRRCPSGSLTVVGDRAQARHGVDGTWPERLARAGFDDVRVATLTLNYRTPEEVMVEAEPVIRAVLPDATVPTSVRRTGVPVEHRSLADLGPVLEEWLGRGAVGTACVVATGPVVGVPDDPRVRVLAPELTKGLEFDLVVLVDPDSYGAGVTGAVDRYVAMTRATQRLVVLAPGDDPPVVR